MMVKHWTFKDYLDAGGTNHIHVWLHRQPKLARARINLVIGRLEVMEHLHGKHIKPLKGPGRGLIELRVFVGGVQYRPIGFHGPGRGEITLLVGAIEKDDKFEPLSACSTAQMRKDDVSNGGSTCDHDFS